MFRAEYIRINLNNTIYPVRPFAAGSIFSIDLRGKNEN